MVRQWSLTSLGSADSFIKFSSVKMIIGSTVTGTCFFQPHVCLQVAYGDEFESDEGSGLPVLRKKWLGHSGFSDH